MGYIGLSAKNDIRINATSDLELTSDNTTIKFGADDDVTITHDPDDGLIFKSIATADDNPFLLTIQTGETDLAANDVIGKIQFQAPDEGTGTDAILVSAAIQAVSEGDFSSSSNATRLEFMTGASEAASERMRIDSLGNVGIGGTPVIWNSGNTALQIGGNGILHGSTALGASKFVALTHNAHIDSDSSWEYISTDEASNYYQSGGAHYFRTAASGTAGNDITWTNVLTILSGGGITFNGDTAQANALDDYEEGVYVPAITINGSASGITYASGTSGNYTKVGRLCVCHIRVNSSDKGSSSGDVRVTLPFTNFNVSTVSAYSTLDYAFNFASLTNDNISLYAEQNSATAIIFHRTSGVAISESNLNDNSQFGVTFSFFTT